METTNQKQQSPQDDEISLKDLILKLVEWYQYLLSKWVVIIILGIIGGMLGLAYSFITKPVYTAECTFVLEEAGGTGGLGPYAGVASMMGIDISGGSSGIFQGDNIMQLYKSRTMIERTLLSTATIGGKKGLLVSRFIEANGLREVWKDDPKLRNIQFAIPQEKFTLQHDSIMGKFVDAIKREYLIVEKPDKKLSVISVKVKAKDEMFAKAFADNIVSNVNAFYIQTKTKKSSENVQLLQKQADSVRRVLNASIGGTASAIDANPNANAALQMLRVPSQRKQVDVQASAAIYAEVAKNLEVARISLRREIPLIQVIDRPVLPLAKDEMGKLAGTLLGACLLALLGMIFLFVKRMLSIVMAP